MVKIQPDGDTTILTAGLTALLRAWSLPASVAMEEGTNDSESPRFARVSFLNGEGWVAVLSSEHDALGAAIALKGGASGVVSLSSPASDLYAAMQTNGQRPFLSGAVVNGLAQGVRDRDEADTEPPPSQPTLTDREREVMGLLALGDTNREIAAKLVVSVNTVRTHVSALAVKLGGSTRGRILANARRARIPEAWPSDDDTCSA